MDIIHSLDSIDKQWLLALNNDYPTFWDGLMYGISEKLTWVPFYLSLIFVIIKFWKKQSIWVVLGLILCVVISDQVSSGIIKDLVQRLRPSHDPEIENMVCVVNGYRGGNFGFVSSHAANSFGLALLSSLLFKNRTYTVSVFAWAVIVSYSRIYLGVHYPGDVLGGAFVGITAALIVYLIFKKFRPNLFVDFHTSELKIRVPLWTLAVSLLALIVYGAWIF